MLLPCVVGVQLSAKINGGLVLLAFEADSLLHSVIALFHTCLLLAFSVCPSVCTLVVAHIWPLSMSQREAGHEREVSGLPTGLSCPRLVVIA